MAKKRVPKSGRKPKPSDDDEVLTPDIIKFSMDQTFVLDAIDADQEGEIEELLQSEHEEEAPRSTAAKRGAIKPPSPSSPSDRRAPRGSSKGDRSGSRLGQRPSRVPHSVPPGERPISQADEVQASADQVLGSERDSSSKKREPTRKKTIDLLTGLTRSQIHELRGYGQQTTYEAGDPIYVKGEPSNGTYVILKGSVEVTLPLWGGQSVEYKTQAGEFFGEEEPGAKLAMRAWNAVARRHTEIFEIPGDAFETFRWMTDARAAMRLLRNSVCILARRLRKRSTRRSSAGGLAVNPAAAAPEHGLVQVLESLLEPNLAADVEHNPYLKHFEIAEGGYLYKRGDSPNGFFIVLEGALEVIGKSRTGRAQKSAVLVAPTVVGEVSNFSKQKRSLSIRAMTPVTVVQFRDDIFTEIRQLEPETALDLLYLTTRFLGGLVAMPKAMLDRHE